MPTPIPRPGAILILTVFTTSEMQSEETKNPASLADIFSQTAETIDQAKKKAIDESKRSTSYLRLDKDGVYRLRILPLAPYLDAQGNPILPMKRQGYEYPSKSLLLKIDTGKTDDKGREIFRYASVNNVTQCLPEVKEDPIETYVKRATAMYPNDKALIEKLGQSSFYGGLKFDHKRNMYVINLDDRAKGIQLFSISWPQYRDLEDTKIAVWEKLAKKTPGIQCPLSSISSGYALEVKRKTDKKTTYKFEIDTLGGTENVTPEEMQTLLSMSRLPEVLYKYERYHYEATDHFLRQCDRQFNINVMEDEAMCKVMEQVKLSLSPEDTSHFSFDGGESAQKMTFEELKEMAVRLDEAGMDDRTDEGKELRTAIREFIDEKQLDVEYRRDKSNATMIAEIEAALAPGSAEEPRKERTPVRRD